MGKANFDLKLRRRRPFGIGGGRYARLRQKCIASAVQSLAPVYIKSQCFTASIKDNNVPTKLTLSKSCNPPLEGYRLLNLPILSSHVQELCLHASMCERGRFFSMKDQPPITIIAEGKPRGLSAVLIAQCHGCGKKFYLGGSPKVTTSDGTQRMDVNIRAVWGSMVTGSGPAHLNELFSTLNCPSISPTTFSAIENEIGKWWQNYADQELIAAGNEERELAIARNDYHTSEGTKVPAITVVCDGGWSKRTHKHTYNALGGVAIIIGAETKKILHIGVRNKQCYTCVKARSKQCEPPAHSCFANWSDSSQSMESDILVEGFREAEKKHGVRYMRLIGDGDSSVYANIIEQVPVWGPQVQKLECANHACKCLRSNLEKLVADKPHYKGSGKLTKAVRVRLVTGVRCAIRMRSSEPDRKTGIKLLKHDIKNSVFHVFGKHDRCTNFCKVKLEMSGVNPPQVPPTPGVNPPQVPPTPGVNPPQVPPTPVADKQLDDSVGTVMSCTSKFWSEVMSDVFEEHARFDFGLNITDLDSAMLADISALLDRLACKADRLIGNFTTNLAECWMSVRCKFDGGKFYNRCQKGSWHARCFGASLRQNVGVLWSPKVFEIATDTPAGSTFMKHYSNVSRNNLAAIKYKSKPESKLKRKRRKLEAAAKSSSKKAKKDYGPDALDVTPDVTPEELQVLKDDFFSNHVSVSSPKIATIESETRLQSSCGRWHSERRNRLTASHFGEIVSRRPAIKIAPLIQRLLYSSFKGTQAMKFGLTQEAVSIKEYLTSNQAENLKVRAMGLVVSQDFNFLAASSGGQVLDNSGNVLGLIEIKNVLHNKSENLFEAAGKSSFCLKYTNGSLSLRRNHKYYFQCQGQLNILEMPWVDFVVRTVNPYQLHIERIERDVDFWKSEMVPKLKAFYFECLLPELACPRYQKSPGIREPGTWFKDKEVKATRKEVKPGTSVCSHPSISQPVSSRCSSRTRRQKLVGRQISHKWIIDEEKGVAKWYSGFVVGVKGVDGLEGAIYQVSYDSESDTYDVENLHEDLESGSLKFLDLS